MSLDDVVTYIATAVANRAAEGNNFGKMCIRDRDNVVAIAPTYGMYEVCADINDVEYQIGRAHV